MARSKVWTGSVWAYEDDVVSSENTFKPVIDVTAPIGTSITVSNGSIGFTRTSTEETTRFDIPSWGTWTVSATINGSTKSKQLVINTVKIYELSIGTLPSIYQEVEYIQANPSSSSAGPRIDTEFKPNSDTRLEIDIDIYQLANIQHFFYAYDSGTTGRYGLLQNGNKYRFDYGTATMAESSFDIATGRHNIVVDKGVTIDGNSYGADSTTFTINANLVLMGATYGQTYLSYTKLYSCRIYDNGVLARDFVPCYNTTTSQIGLYDLANDRFYINSGSGSFTKGPDVNQGGNV